jgi:hypothetical protein
VTDQTPASAPVTDQDAPVGPGPQPDAPEPPQAAVEGFAPCRTTQHCAYHGWCHRCDPAFAAVMSRVNVAIQRNDANDSHWGPLYEAVGQALRDVGEQPARTTPDNGATSSDAADNSLREGIAAAVRGCVEEGNIRYGHVADTVLAVIAEHLDIGEEQAWCKTCRRAWDGARHRCESDGEQQAVQLRATLRQALDAFEAYWARASYCGPSETAVQPEHFRAWRNALDGKEQL